MKFYLSSVEYDLLVELSLLNGLYVEITRVGSMTYIELTGTQTRELIKRLFDALSMDIIDISEKRILSFLGWRLTEKCL